MTTPALAALAGCAGTVVQPGDDAVEHTGDDAVEHTGAEVLVIGLRRRTAVGKLLLGSAAQRILLAIKCPVLAVKGPPTSAS